MIIRWRDLLVAVFFAVLFWYGVTGSEKVESQVEVRVDYRGMPANMTVLHGLVNRVSVRVSAPVGMIRTMYARQDYMISVDLSNVIKGENILPIKINQYLFGRGVDVIDISPPRIYLSVDQLETDLIPLKVNIQNELLKDYTVSYSLVPERVLVKGAQSIIDEMSELSVQVLLQGDLAEGRKTFKKVIPLPEGVDATPTMAEVHVDIGLNRKEITFIVPVTVLNAENTPVSTSHQHVQVKAAVPASNASETKMKWLATATVMPPAKGTLEEVMPVVVSLPENCRVISIVPEEITVRVLEPAPTNSPENSESNK